MQIIVHKKSGFHLDPYHGEAAAELMVEFFEDVVKDHSVWDRVSEASLQRIKEKYTWALYADRLMTLTRVYRYEVLQEASLQAFCINTGKERQGLAGPFIVHHGKAHLGTVPRAPHNPH